MGDEDAKRWDYGTFLGRKSATSKASSKSSQGDKKFRPPARKLHPDANWTAFSHNDVKAWSPDHKSFSLKEGTASHMPEEDRNSYGQTFGTLIDERSSQVIGEHLQAERLKVTRMCGGSGERLASWPPPSAEQIWGPNRSNTRARTFHDRERGYVCFYSE